MDKPSPPTSSSPSSASGQSSTAKQPTYTTAGTIYNPNSTQPLQPPARRARSLKWTTGGSYSDLSLLPRSLLASLPTKYPGPGNARGAAVPVVQSPQQYTPLQQNYERALNPITRLDYLADEMSPRSLAASSDNASPRHAGLLHHDLDFFAPDVENDGDDEEENDDEGIDNIMMNMTVKSLQNLASYPNPNQRKAQKALSRPVKPRLNAGGQAVTGADAGGQPYFQPSLSMTQEYAQRPRNSLRHSYSDSATISSAGHALHQDGGPNETSWVPSKLAKAPSIIGDIVEQPDSWQRGPNVGTGPPRPLTAGPPGQRQYRPSTFESTFKALQTNSRRPARRSDDDVYFMGDGLAQGSSEGPSRLTPVYDGGDGDTYAQLFRDSEELRSTQNAARFHGSMRYADEEQNGQMHSSGSFALAQGSGFWNRPNMHRQRSAHGGSKLSAELCGKNEYDAHTEKINGLWYEGCEMFCGSIIEADDEVGKQAVVGVIGDGRPGHDGNRHRQVKVEEAIKTDTSEHAKPLFNMAIASMEWSLSQQGFRSQ